MSKFIDTEDEEPVFNKSQIADLEVMSIEALVEYIEELRMEIKRAEGEIKIKQDARLGAQSIFKS